MLGAAVLGAAVLVLVLVVVAVVVRGPCGQVPIRFKGCGPGRGKSSRDAKRLETWLQGPTVSELGDQRSPGMTSSDWSEKPCSVDSR